jgi:hypothetical protein
MSSIPDNIFSNVSIPRLASSPFSSASRQATIAARSSPGASATQQIGAIGNTTPTQVTGALTNTAVGGTASQVAPSQAVSQPNLAVPSVQVPTGVSVQDTPVSAQQTPSQDTGTVSQSAQNTQLETPPLPTQRPAIQPTQQASAEPVQRAPSFIPSSVPWPQTAVLAPEVIQARIGGFLSRGALVTGEVFDELIGIQPSVAADGDIRDTAAMNAALNKIHANYTRAELDNLYTNPALLAAVRNAAWFELWSSGRLAPELEDITFFNALHNGLLMREVGAPSNGESCTVNGCGIGQFTATGARGIWGSDAPYSVTQVKKLPEVNIVSSVALLNKEIIEEGSVWAGVRGYNGGPLRNSYANNVVDNYTPRLLLASKAKQANPDTEVQDAIYAEDRVDYTPQGRVRALEWERHIEAQAIAVGDLEQQVVAHVQAIEVAVGLPARPTDAPTLVAANETASETGSIIPATTGSTQFGSLVEDILSSSGLTGGLTETGPTLTAAQTAGQTVAQASPSTEEPSVQLASAPAETQTASLTGYVQDSGGPFTHLSRIRNFTDFARFIAGGGESTVASNAAVSSPTVDELFEQIPFPVQKTAEQLQWIGLSRDKIYTLGELRSMQAKSAELQVFLNSSGHLPSNRFISGELLARTVPVIKAFQAEFNHTLRVNGVGRSVEVNYAVGGVSNSIHLGGNAIDFRNTDLPAGGKAYLRELLEVQGMQVVDIPHGQGQHTHAQISDRTPHGQQFTLQVGAPPELPTRAPAEIRPTLVAETDSVVQTTGAQSTTGTEAEIVLAEAQQPQMITVTLASFTERANLTPAAPVQPVASAPVQAAAVAPATVDDVQVMSQRLTEVDAFVSEQTHGALVGAQQAAATFEQAQAAKAAAEELHRATRDMSTALQSLHTLGTRYFVSMQDVSTGQMQRALRSMRTASQQLNNVWARTVNAGALTEAQESTLASAKAAVDRTIATISNLEASLVEATGYSPSVVQSFRPAQFNQGRQRIAEIETVRRTLSSRAAGVVNDSEKVVNAAKEQSTLATAQLMEQTIVLPVRSPVRLAQSAPALESTETQLAAAEPEVTIASQDTGVSVSDTQPSVTPDAESAAVSETSRLEQFAIAAYQATKDLVQNAVGYFSRPATLVADIPTPAVDDISIIVFRPDDIVPASVQQTTPSDIAPPPEPPPLQVPEATPNDGSIVAQFEEVTPGVGDETPVIPLDRAPQQTGLATRNTVLGTVNEVDRGVIGAAGETPLPPPASAGALTSRSIIDGTLIGKAGAVLVAGFAFFYGDENKELAELQDRLANGAPTVSVPSAGATQTEEEEGPVAERTPDAGPRRGPDSGLSSLVSAPRRALDGFIQGGLTGVMQGLTGQPQSPTGSSGTTGSSTGGTPATTPSTRPQPPQLSCGPSPIVLGIDTGLTVRYGCSTGTILSSDFAASAQTGEVQVPITSATTSRISAVCVSGTQQSAPTTCTIPVRNPALALAMPTIIDANQQVSISSAGFDVSRCALAVGDNDPVEGARVLTAVFSTIEESSKVVAMCEVAPQVIIVASAVLEVRGYNGPIATPAGFENIPDGVQFIAVSSLLPNTDATPSSQLPTESSAAPFESFDPIGTTELAPFDPTPNSVVDQISDTGSNTAPCDPETSMYAFTQCLLNQQ